MDLNLGPDLEQVLDLQHDAEMDFLAALKALERFNGTFGLLLEKLADIKKDLPESAFKIEKEAYANVRDKSKFSQPAQNERGGQKKPQLHTPQGDQRQPGVAFARGQEEKRSKIL